MVRLDTSTDLLPCYRFSHERILSLHALGRRSQQNLTDSCYAFSDFIQAVCPGSNNDFLRINRYNYAQFCSIPSPCLPIEPIECVRFSAALLISRLNSWFCGCHRYFKFTCFNSCHAQRPIGTHCARVRQKPFIKREVTS